MVLLLANRSTVLEGFSTDVENLVIFWLWNGPFAGESQYGSRGVLSRIFGMVFLLGFSKLHIKLYQENVGYSLSLEWSFCWRIGVR